MKKYLGMSSAAVVIGALRVKVFTLKSLYFQCFGLWPSSGIEVNSAKRHSSLLEGSK